MKKILFSICLILCTALISSAQNNNTSAPIMSFSEETHDFGTIKEGPEVSYDFWFTNTGKEPLIIRKCSASCGCTTPDWTKAPVMPGQRGKITVKYTTEGHPNTFNKTVYIFSNAKSDKEVIEIFIKGNVAPKVAPAIPSGTK